MAHKFTIRAESGKPDSLRESVKIFFTLTPVESNHLTPSCYPRQRWWKQFDVGVDRREEADWDSDLTFCRYEFTGDDKKNIVGFFGSNISAGEAATMNSPGGRGIAWGERGIAWGERTAQSPIKRSTVVAINRTTSAQNVCLAVRSPGGMYADTIALFDPVQIGKSLTVPSDLVLQVYAVDPSRDLDNIHVPGPEDLTRPLFPVPLSCSELPESSSWKLSQDRNGEIKLISDGEMELRKHSIETLAKSIHDMHSRMSLVFKTLDDTQQRLATFEKLLSDNQAQLFMTRNDLSAARAELSASNRAASTAEAKPAEIEASFARVDARVALMESSLADAHEGIASGKRGLGNVCTQLLAMEKASTATKGALSAIQESYVATQHRVSALDEKVPALEEKLSELGAAFGSSEKRVSAMGSSLIAHKNRLSDLADRQIPQLEAKSKQMENSYSLDKLSMMPKSVDLARDHLSTLDRRVLSIETRGELITPMSPGPQGRVDSSQAGGSAPVIQGQVVGLDRQAPVADARADELERSLTETKKDVSVMRKLLRTRLPTLESKADTLEKSIGQVQEELSVVQLSLASSGGRLTGLDTRMAAVEGSLRGIGTDPRDPGPTTASLSPSPLLFPSQGRESRSSTPSPSREAAFFDRGDSDSEFGE